MLKQRRNPGALRALPAIPALPTTTDRPAPGSLPALCRRAPACWNAYGGTRAPHAAARPGEATPEPVPRRVPQERTPAHPGAGAPFPEPGPPPGAPSSPPSPATARVRRAHRGAAAKARRGEVRPDPRPGAAPPEARRDALRALGRDEALFRSGGRTVRLGRRHSEILVLLARHPGGLTGEELLIGLYEDEAVSPVTLRAELCRLRALLGPRALLSRPYRLAAPVDSDFGLVNRRLALGAASAALAAYPGPLLPSSAAPEVVRLRGRLTDQVRAALIARGDPGLLTDWADSPWGEEDLEVWRALAAALPPERRAPALARARRLDAELRG